MHVHLDPVGGLAGDMFVAALLDAFPPLEERVQAGVRAAGLPSRFRCEVVRHHDGVLQGRRFVVHEDGTRHAHSPDHAHGSGHTHAHPHSHLHAHPHPHGDGDVSEPADTHLGAHARDHEHGHRPFAEIRAALHAAPLSDSVRDIALAVFGGVAEAEADAHGASVDAVSFHELGEWDSIADIVAAAVLIDALGSATWSISALPLGGGFVPSAHGLIPVPAPATTWLLRGLAVRDDGIGGERVTPTGAAIARYLVSRPGVPPRERRLLGTGLGFGTRRLPGLSNCVRAVVFDGAPAVGIESATDDREDRVLVIEFEVDDQSPEDLALGLDHVRAEPGVLDVLQMPALGKKGRVSICVRVLCRPGVEDDVVAACFSETTTLGVRISEARRRILSREALEVNVAGADLRVKVADRQEGATVKVEAETLRAVRGHEAREALRREASRTRRD